MQKPEILAPAGNLSKLKVALSYGADAVYVGAPQYGLRQGADNLSYAELEQAVQFAHQRLKKVYVAMNAMPHQHEIDGLVECLKRLQEIGPDALIISDAGVFAMAKEHTKIPIHISTQASVTNAHTAEMWARAGAKRVVLAREVSLDEARQLLEQTPIELETFVHGAMCTSYSGKCTISNYTAGRDSNRGGCIQSCRFQYQIYSEGQSEVEASAYIMNARDLMAVKLLPDIIRSGLSCLKIEGRMKSPLYVAQASRIYRQALDECWQMHLEGRLEDWNPGSYEQQLEAISNRTFAQGSLQQRAFGESLQYEHGGYVRGWQFVGLVRGYDADKGVLLEVKFPFDEKDSLNILNFDRGEVVYSHAQVTDILGQELSAARPNSLVYLAGWNEAPEHSVVVMADKKAG